MLSYRHGFHAGNHADVLKHSMLVFLLDYLSRKEKPWQFVDTHAGAARYDLRSEWSRMQAEHESGIARLWERGDLPPLLAAYVEHVRRLNPDGKLRHYPGSPQIAWQCARASDRLRLFELHSTESGVLASCFSDAGSRVQVKAQDGYTGLIAVLPPPSRRGLALIDPSYEQKSDYVQVVNVLNEALKRFATGSYMVWYPLLQRTEARELPRTLERFAQSRNLDWLDASLTVSAPSPDGLGMHGSGVFVINPPYTAPAALEPALAWLRAALKQAEGAAYHIAFQIG
jgi:23S rRNA (adenine2030-N6)-methyltransferase